MREKQEMNLEGHRSRLHEDCGEEAGGHSPGTGARERLCSKV